MKRAIKARKSTHTSRFGPLMRARDRVTTRWAGSAEMVRIGLSAGHFVTLHVVDGWLVVSADSTMTVRPVNEREIYIRPVGYVGGWVPEFAIGKIKENAYLGAIRRVNEKQENRRLTGNQ